MEEEKKPAKVLSWLKQLLTILALALLISVFIIQTYNVNDVSMEPTFDRQGNRVLVFLTPYIFNAEPNHGDIVIIDSRPDGQRTIINRFLDSPLLALVLGRVNEDIWIKRVIGLPGDSIEFNSGYVYRNSEKLEEEYVMGQMRDEFKPVLVPEGYVFIMGDNRNRSSDSRHVGPLPVKNIQGRAIMRFLPLDKIDVY